MLKIIIEALWYLLPAGAANMAPVIAAHLFPRWNTPVDFGARLGGVRIFGDHKTIRGIFFGILAGGGVFLLQHLLYATFPMMHAFGYHAFDQMPFWFGFWQGFCALSGDLTKSYFKRRIDLEPGESWIPFDQIDWIIGTLLGSIPFLHFTSAHVVAAVALAFFLSLLTHRAGYAVGWNSDAQ